MKKNYLEKYFEQNNDVKQRLSINRKLVILLITFMICSISYLLINIFKSNNITGDLSVAQTFILYTTIMNITYLITVIGVILTIFIHKKIIKVSFKTKSTIYNILDWFIILPICVVISSFLFNFVFSVTEVSGDSMYPTIKEGSELVLNYRKDYNRNDVVVINVNGKHNVVIEEKYYLKRIVGVPGDKIRFEQQGDDIKLYINDNLYDDYLYVSDPNLIKLSSYKSKLFALDEDGKATFGYVDDKGDIVTEEEIPAGFYFVLGDNWCVSHDSRAIGLVRKTDIVGVTKYEIVNHLIFWWRKIG